MSTNEKKPEAKEEPQRFATLKRGRVYYLRERVFERGVPQPISPEDEEWLAENAVDEVTVEGEGEHQPRPKFIFTTGPAGEAPAEAANSPRRRSR